MILQDQLALALSVTGFDLLRFRAMVRSSLPAKSKTQIIGSEHEMQPAASETSTCPTCGELLTVIPGGGLGCAVCLFRGVIGTNQDSTLSAEEFFGSYKIDRHSDGSLYELGRGAMGVTYRATDTTLQRKVALKIIKIDIAERSTEARERFMREARAAAALRHQNIATVHQFGIREETGQYFYAMELIEGETLEERVHRAGPLDAWTTIDIAQQVTSALGAAEERGLVHRDLKPANLMLVKVDDPEVMGSDHARSKRSRIRALRKSGIPVVKIIDFGLAKAIHTQTDPQSLTHDRFVGTPAFASPEQFEHSALDIRSDVYSLGETLWFALTGKTPFKGHSVEEIHQAQQSNVLPIEQLKAAHVPSRFRSLLESMLAVDPAARPGTDDLAARLESCSAGASRVRRTHVAFATLLIALTAVAGWIVWKSELISRPAVKGIAVLPFENLSPDPDNAYFAGGVQDEILTNLARVADLKVISRTSTMRYKSEVARNLREIGRQLGVAHVVEGNVQREGNRVRVSAQLIDARSDRHVWAQTYDRDLADMFAIQSELAQKIANELRAKLSPSEKARIERKPTENGEAYLAFVQAYNLSSPFQDFEREKQGEQLYERAIKLDPNFALAMARYSQLESWILHDREHTAERHEKAYALAKRALQIQSDLPEAHLALGFSYYYGDNNYDAALKEFEIAQRGLPNEAEVYLALGAIQRRQGKWAESTANLEKSVSLNPNDIWTLQNLTFNYVVLRNYDAANKATDRALALVPTEIQLLRIKAKLAIAEKGDFSVAERAFENLKSVQMTNEQKLYVTVARVDVFLQQRKYQEALRDAESLPDDQFVAYSDWAPWHKYFYIGIARRALQDGPGAQAAFLKAKSAAEEQLKRTPDDAKLRIQLAKILAFLGEKASALAEAQRASELQRESKDALQGPDVTEGVAQVCGIIGDNNRAIEILEGLLNRPSYVTVQGLRVNPIWDPLRFDPRFQKLCEQKQR
jgi:serine/threonine protein kinase/Flp pilus assembly protein TadD